MPSPKDPWSSPSQEMRKRKKVQVTLSDEARAKLDRLVRANGGKGMMSWVIEQLILKAEEKKL